MSKQCPERLRAAFLGEPTYVELMPQEHLYKFADGWEGRARWQPVSTGDRTVLFTGGGQQLAVPDLTWQQIGIQYSGWPPAG
jgi:hypothetical protein